MNIAEILKYCPKGTMLYSPAWGEVGLLEVSSLSYIKIKTKDIYSIHILNEEGKYAESGECVLFPSKDQRDWKKFRLPVKRGDIVMDQEGRNICIVNKYDFCYGITTFFMIDHDSCNKGWKTQMDSNLWVNFFWIPASEEAKKTLFDKLAKAGYKWNAKTLELEEIKKPKFKPFDKVLVRKDNLDFWTCSFFSHISSEYDAYPYHCVNGAVHAQCIPYEGNEHLLGTRKKE